MSDLHIDHDVCGILNHDGSINDNLKTGADVLILAGDISELRYLFLDEASSNFHHKVKFDQLLGGLCDIYSDVILVTGNHEYYRSNYLKRLDPVRDNLSRFKNLHILENQSIEINGLTFFGGTCWTDFNNGCPITKMEVSSKMNDYRAIKFNYNKLRPHIVESIHNDFLYKLRTLREVDKVFVISHHAPLRDSIDPKYANQFYMNGGYASDLSNLILDLNNITHWAHGHVHTEFDYMFNSTNVVCKPRGYPMERFGIYKPKIIDVFN